MQLGADFLELSDDGNYYAQIQAFSESKRQHADKPPL
jgi:hypothetical protein